MTSSTCVCGPCMPSVSCVHTACAFHFCSSKLTYAAPALCGFSTSADRHRIETFLRRAARSGLWDSATTADCRGTSWRCWWTIVFKSSALCTPRSWRIVATQHNLWKRRHNITLSEKKGHLAAIALLLDCCTKTPHWLQYRLSHNLTFSHFYRATLRCTVFVIVILSVCLSVTLMDCVHMVSTYDHDFFTM